MKTTKIKFTKNAEGDYVNNMNSLRIWHSCTTADYGLSRWSVTNAEGTVNYPLSPDAPHWTQGSLADCKKFVAEYITLEKAEMLQLLLTDKSISIIK
jgi:hypothetical protein